jgi:hypothetical protein
MKSAICVVVIVGIVVLPAALLGAQEKNRGDQILSERVRQFALTNETVLGGLRKISSEQNQFRFGFEAVLRSRFSDPPLPEVRFSMHLEDRTIRQILNALCEADRRYKWSIDGAIVNVYPRSSSLDRNYLLNRRLSKFYVRGITDVEEGLLAIARQLPPPVEQIAHVQVGGDASYPAEPWTASFADLTVRQVVNRLTEHMGPHACWTFDGAGDLGTFAFYKWGFHEATDDQ